VLSSDFKAVVIDDENKQSNVDVEGEFYHGYEECTFSVLIMMPLFENVASILASSVCVVR